MGNDRNDPDEKFGHDMEPEEVFAAIFEDAGVEETQPDVISDPGVEGGVDASNEEPEEDDAEA